MQMHMPNFAKIIVFASIFVHSHATPSLKLGSFDTYLTV